MLSVFSSERHISSISNTRDSLQFHPTRVLQHRQSNDNLVLGRRKNHFVLMIVFFLAYRKMFLTWGWEMDSLSILHCYSPIYLQTRISVLPPGLILMHVRMRGPQDSHLFLAASSVFSDAAHQVALITVTGSGLEDLSTLLDLRLNEFIQGKGFWFMSKNQKLSYALYLGIGLMVKSL